jgi:hypothetical protein
VSTPTSPEPPTFDDNGPTPSVDEFLVMQERDSNLWWRIGCGHHENLFDSAVEQRDALRAAIQAVQKLCDEPKHRHVHVGHTNFYVATSSLRAALAAAGVDQEDTEQRPAKTSRRRDWEAHRPVLKGVGDTGQADEPQPLTLPQLTVEREDDTYVYVVTNTGVRYRIRREPLFGAGQVVPQQPTTDKRHVWHGSQCVRCAGLFSLVGNHPCSGDTTGGDE